MELYHGIHKRDLVLIADGLADVAYLLIRTALCYGIPLDEVFAEVHRSNMTKDGSRRDDGKILKGDKFEPPRIKEILDRHSASGK
jgi:predicted HAD superfamily Cof-like phosphohydrolase